jgi:hypothetical protein
MRYSSQVKPISYFKANAAEVLTHLASSVNLWSSPKTAKPSCPAGRRLVRRNARNTGLAKNPRAGQPGCGRWQGQACG